MFPHCDTTFRGIRGRSELGKGKKKERYPLLILNSKRKKKGGGHPSYRSDSSYEGGKGRMNTILRKRGGGKRGVLSSVLLQKEGEGKRRFGQESRRGEKKGGRKGCTSEKKKKRDGKGVPLEKIPVSPGNGNFSGEKKRRRRNFPSSFLENERKGKEINVALM